MQCNPDEPTAELGFTRYITWVWHVCLLIAWTRPLSLMLCNACQWSHHPSTSGSAEAESHSASNLFLTLKSGRGSDVEETKTVFWWNGRRGHRTCYRVISFYGDMWRVWSKSLLSLLGLMNSSRESLLHWIMLPKTCYIVIGKGLTTDLTCVVSQAVNKLNTNCYEIAVGFRFMPLSLVRLRTFRLSTWVGWV